MTSSTQSQGCKTDGYPTPTTDEQISVENILKNFIPAHPNSKLLDRNTHVNYLVRMLLQGLPVRYVSQDASQPWILFWILQAISIMSVSLDTENKQKYVFSDRLDW